MLLAGIFVAANINNARQGNSVLRKKRERKAERQKSESSWATWFKLVVYFTTDSIQVLRRFAIKSPFENEVIPQSEVLFTGKRDVTAPESAGVETRGEEHLKLYLELKL